MVAIGQAFAGASDLTGIRALLSFYPYALAPRLLDVLSGLPETLVREEWVALIQEVGVDVPCAGCFMQPYSCCLQCLRQSSNQPATTRPVVTLALHCWLGTKRADRQLRMDIIDA